jgi:hypothetical protein
MKAVITIADCEDGTLNVSVEFDPAMNDESAAHYAAVRALNYLASNGESDEE